MLITVRVTPRGGANRIDRVEADCVHLRVQPPPADGQANDAVVRLLSDWLHIPRRQIRLQRGATARTKVFDVEGLDALPPFTG